MNPTLYIGCDAHKSACTFCAIDEDGKTVWQGERPTTREGFENIRDKFSGHEIKLVLEALGFVWQIVDMLSELGIETYVCNPNQNPLIGFSRKKTDPEDARKLAELLRIGYLKCIYIPTKQQREFRILARERNSMVRTRVRFINQGKSAAYDHQVERRNRLIELVSEEIELLNGEISEAAAPREDVRLLMTTPGLAEYGASLVAGEICAIDRFSRSRQYLAYCGLVPSIRQSGGKTRMGSTRKDSNSRLRWIYVQAAWHAVRRDPEMTDYFNRKAREKGKKKAIVIIAKKLAARNYWMLKRKMPYREVSAVKTVG